MSRFTLLRTLLTTLAITAAPGCGSGGDAAAPDGPGDNPSGGQLPDSLVGTWRWEEIGDVVCDPATGQCTNSFARSQKLELSDDGHFTHVLVYESHLAGCDLEVLHQSDGTAEAQGGSLLLHISAGTTKVDNTCGESGITDESGQTDTYDWEIRGGEAGVPELILVDEEGTTLGPFQPE